MKIRNVYGISIQGAKKISKILKEKYGKTTFGSVFTSENGYGYVLELYAEPKLTEMEIQDREIQKIMQSESAVFKDGKIVSKFNQKDFMFELA